MNRPDKNGKRRLCLMRWFYFKTFFIKRIGFAERNCFPGLHHHQMSSKHWQYITIKWHSCTVKSMLTIACSWFACKYFTNPSIIRSPCWKFVNYNSASDEKCTKFFKHISHFLWLPLPFLCDVSVVISLYTFGYYLCWKFRFFFRPIYFFCVIYCVVYLLISPLTLNIFRKMPYENHLILMNNLNAKY